jgi:hypothetical protein
MSDERVDAIRLANKLLDEPNADPDDDLRMLSRQFLRRNERVESFEAMRRAIESERLTWAMTCECYCPACKRFDLLLRTGTTGDTGTEP